MTETSTTAQRPAYAGVRMYPTDRTLPYEHSAFTAVNPDDQFQPITEMVKVQERLEFAQGKLRSIVGEPIPTDPSQRSWKVREGIEGARRALHPHYNPGSPHNEVPAFNPDGTLVAEHVGKAGGSVEHPLYLPDKAPAIVGIDNILYRQPAERVQHMNWQQIDDAGRKLQDISVRLSHVDSRSGTPYIEGAIRDIDVVKAQLNEALGQQTSEPRKGAGGLWNRARNAWAQRTGREQVLQGVVALGAQAA